MFKLFFSIFLFFNKIHHKITIYTVITIAPNFPRKAKNNIDIAIKKEITLFNLTLCISLLSTTHIINSFHFLPIIVILSFLIIQILSITF